MRAQASPLSAVTMRANLRGIKHSWFGEAEQCLASYLVSR